MAQPYAHSMLAFSSFTPFRANFQSAALAPVTTVPHGDGSFRYATVWRRRKSCCVAPELMRDKKSDNRLHATTSETVEMSASESNIEKRPPEWLLQVNHFLVRCAVAGVNALYEGAKEPWYRLWVLEVVARVPYFSFLCILHLAESLGLGSERLSELQRQHFEENENEAVHLAIMATLGGGLRFRDRFIAQHAAIVYYVGTCVAYVISPSLAYHFSTLVEQHAFETYDKLLRNEEVYLKEIAPVPLIARKYYQEREVDSKQICSMWDVILAIRDDEAKHSEDLDFYSLELFGDVPWRYPPSFFSGK